MIKVQPTEPVVIETERLRFYFRNIDMLISANGHHELSCRADMIYDKVENKFLKNRHVGNEIANMMIDFALGVK